MSFRQIFDRIARIAQAEASAARGSDFERELRRAEELIEESRRPRRSDVDEEGDSPGTTPGNDPEYLRACRTIGVPPGTAQEQIARTYRARARDYHPDRVAHLPANAQKEALRRMQELNLAYEYLVRRASR